MCCSSPCCGGSTWAGDTSLPLLFLTLCPPFRRCQPPPALASPPYLQCDLAWSSSLVPFPPGHSCSLTQVFVMCSTPVHAPLSSAQCKAVAMCDYPLPPASPSLFRPEWPGLQLGVGKEVLLKRSPPTLHLKGLKVPPTAFKKSVFLSPAQSPSQSGRQAPGPTVWLLSPPTMQSAEVPRPSASPPNHHLTSFFCVYFILFLWFLEQFKLPVYFHKRK